MTMIRLVAAALTTTGALARWGDSDAIKEMAAREVDRRHNLAELHKKGSEKRHPQATLTRIQRVFADDHKETTQSRLLKRTRDRNERISGKEKLKGKRPKEDKDNHTEDAVEQDEVDVATIIKKTGMNHKYASKIDWTKNRPKNTQLGAAKPSSTMPFASTASISAVGESISTTGSKSSKSKPVSSATTLPNNSRNRLGPAPSIPSSPAPRTSANTFLSEAAGDGKYDKSDRRYSLPETEPWSYFESGKSGKSGKSTGPGKSAKSGGGKSTGRKICNKRLSIAFKELVDLSPDDRGPFGIIEDPSDVTELCYFDPPSNEGDFNLGCPFIYLPEIGFVKGVNEYKVIFGDEAGVAFQSLVMYCECFQGFELGCAAKIPHGPPATTKETLTSEVIVNGYSEFIPFSTPANRADYCEMVGVWNGDFDAEIERDFKEDVADCGCYFIGQAQDMVNQCPGVDLGAFFGFDPDTAAPTSDSTAPSTESTQDTTAPTPAIPDAQFYDSFEQAAFPEDPWSVSNSSPSSSRRLSSNGMSNWELTKEEAYTGVYSIRSPDLSNDEFEQLQANVVLIADEDVGDSTLTFSLFSTLNFPADGMAIFVDGENINTITEPTDGWETFEIILGPGSHEVTWVYVYDPLAGEGDLPEAGMTFIDEVYITPRLSSAPTIPSASTEPLPTTRPMAFPTSEPFSTTTPTTQVPGTTPSPTTATTGSSSTESTSNPAPSSYAPTGTQP